MPNATVTAAELLAAATAAGVVVRLAPSGFVPVLSSVALPPTALVERRHGAREDLAARLIGRRAISMAPPAYDGGRRPER